MSYNGSGTFQINTSGQPVVAGTVISSTAFNALTADLATGLSTAITKDGQTTTTARIPFAAGINSTLVTDSTNSTSGSIITAGGVGVAKALYVGTTANVAGAVTLQSTLNVTGVATFSAAPIYSSLTASSAVATDASKALVSVTNTGTGNNVLATSPTLVTPVLGAASATSITVDAGAVGTPSITTTGDTNTGIFFPAADTIAFSEGGVESARFDSAGNFGLGVTPTSTWNSAFKVTEIKAAGNAFFAGGSGWTLMSSNAFYGASGWQYGATGNLATAYEQFNGTHVFKIAPNNAGAAGATCNFTQAMTLDASGNLGIGTTSPAEKLHVVGKIAVSGTNPSIRQTVQNAFLDLCGGTTVGTDPAIQIAGSTTTSDANKIFYNSNSHVFRTTSGGTTYATIDTSGNLLVGTTTNNGVITSYTSSNTGRAGFFMINAASSLATDAVGISKFDNNTTTSQVFVKFFINNNATASGLITANGANQATFTSSSDARLKENIVELSPQLDNIMALRPVEFDYIESEGGGHQIGFIAQEVQEVYPDVVGIREDGMFLVSDLNKNDARLIKAIQEMKAIIDTQASTIQSLTARITALESN